MAKNNTEEKKETIDLKKIKKELTDYVDEQIKKNSSSELEKANKRLIKEKNKKILVKNIVIIFLIVLVCFLIYLLYGTGYFNKFLVEDTNNETKVIEDSKEVVNDNKVETKTDEATLDELKEEYSMYLDNIYISENSEYIKDYYNGKLTTELKNYITLNKININDLEKEDEYNIIDEDLFETTYENIFNDNYTNKTFKYNSITIRYLSSLKLYITDSIIKKDSTNIKREIIDIKVSDDGIVITTVEGLIKDKKLYNILSNEQIEDYDNKNLSNYEDSLNKVVYTFNINGKLLKIA